MDTLLFFIINFIVESGGNNENIVEIENATIPKETVANKYRLYSSFFKYFRISIFNSSSDRRTLSHSIRCSLTFVGRGIILHYSLVFFGDSLDLNKENRKY